jgi:hypothetical protein
MVCVVYGSSTYRDTIFLPNDTTLTKISGETLSDDNLGEGLLAEDFNGDGVGDLFIGAPRSDPMGRDNSGLIHVFYGVNGAVSIISQSTPSLKLYQNRPNPFSNTTTIDYVSVSPGNIVLTIYNVRGQRVTQIERYAESAGIQSISWDGRDKSGVQVPSGVYFYRVHASKSVAATKKMVIVR